MGETEVSTRVPRELFRYLPRPDPASKLAVAAPLLYPRRVMA
jgi:hypothetical protein